MEDQALVSFNPFLSRIDKVLADNTAAIKNSYGDDAGIVMDFIIFLGKNMKADLFGFTTFTMADFAKASGRKRQQLSARHPYSSMPFAKNVQYNGREYLSVFDYVLYQMMYKNVLFAKQVELRLNGKVTSMHSMQIITDINIFDDKNIDAYRRNKDRGNGEKLYQIRVSDEILQGFITRYYTLESNGYPLVGEGRGGEGRKMLYVLIEKARHILKNSNQNVTHYAVNYLCDVAQANFSKAAERKIFITKQLNILIEKGHLPFKFTFVKGNNEMDEYSRGYWVKIEFNSAAKYSLSESTADHKYYLNLVSDLQSFFDSKYQHIQIEGETSSFQRWLNNNRADLDEKIQIVTRNYGKAYSRVISRDKALELMNLWYK